MGINVFDISNVNQDNISLLKELYMRKPGYYITQIRSSNINLINILENYGFHFIEFKIKYMNYTSDFTHYLSSNNISFVKINNKNLYSSYIVKSAESLKIDRFSNDPLLSYDSSISAKRYKQYFFKSIDSYDEDMYLIYHADFNDYIGFFSFKNNQNNSALFFLGGLFSEYRNKGLGKFYVMSYHTCLYDNNISSFISNISGSNIPICNLNLGKFSGTILETYVIMRKFIK